MIAALVFVAIVFLLLLYGIGIYNKLVRLRNMVREAWSGIDVMLKKRYDLIPNLVETVKGYTSHERQTLESVIEARSKALGAASVKRRKLLKTTSTGRS